MILTLFEAVKQAYTRPDQVIDADWEEIAQLLTTFRKVEKKEDALLFNLWSFDMAGEPGRKYKYVEGRRTNEFTIIPGTIRRCRDTALGISGLVLDYDGHKTITQAVLELEGLTYALYTTFRHSEEKHKFRVVLPFSRVLDKDEFESKKDDISDCFPFADYSSFSESQSFYLHSGPDPKLAVAFYNTATSLDPSCFLNKVIQEAPVVTARSEFTGSADKYKDTLLKSLRTCRGLHYNGPYKYNVLTLVSLCKTAGISYEEYDSLCYQIAAADSGLKDERQRQVAWDGWGSTAGVTKAKREEFISCHGGRSYFTHPEKPMNSEQLKEYVRNKYKKEINNG